MASTGAAGGVARNAFSSSLDHTLSIRIYVRDATEGSGGRKRPLTVRPWSTVKDIKDQLFHLTAVPPSSQRLFIPGPLQNFGVELPNHWTVLDAGIDPLESKAEERTFTMDVRSGSGRRVFDSKATSSPDSISLYGSRTQQRQERVADIKLADAMKGKSPKALLHNIQRSRRGFILGFKPELVLDGSGGTYFLHDSNKNKNGVFKPSDEEPYATNNPRGYVNTNFSFHDSFSSTCAEENNLALRAGVKPGESCLREVAAFVLDYDGFCSVPMTTLVVARHPAFHNAGTRLKVYEGGAGFGSHCLSSTSGLLSSPTPTYGFVAEKSPILQGDKKSPPLSSREGHQAIDNRSLDKIGSYQEFVRSECTMDDLSPSLISVHEVQKIALLDIRLLNADRNAGNLLVRRNQDNSLTLVPIDHGYCLRSVCDISSFDWCWLEWKQTKKPVTGTVQRYIRSLDVERDIVILKESFDISQKAVDYFRAATKLLQSGIAAGLTLYDVANMVCRLDFDGEIPSILETIVSQASEFALSAVENFRFHHSNAAKALTNSIAVRALPSPQALSVTKDGVLLSTGSDFLHDATSSNLSSDRASVGLTKSSPPASANTSCSESVGTDDLSDDENKEDAEELFEDWATAVIADANKRRATRPRPSRPRSVSNDSSSTEDSSSESVSGFWTTRPKEVEEFSSSSCFSVDEVMTSSEIPTSESKSSGGKDCAMMESHPTELPSNSTPRNEDVGLLSPDQSLSYLSISANSNQGNDFLTPPPHDPLASLDGQVLLPLEKKSGVMKRSQSYSVFSNASHYMTGAATCPNHDKKKTLDKRDSNQKQHQYYTMKFIDLLIEREIRAFCRRRDRAESDL